MTNNTFLKENGFIVLPFIDLIDREKHATTFLQTARHFPEFKDNLSENNFKFVNGGFSAFGNPASFHNPFVREMRIKAFAKFSELFEGCGRNAHTLFDRMMIRPINAAPTAELWHRDITPNLPKDDLMFGGWINFDSTSQYFSCVPGTHNDEKDETSGFTKLNDKNFESYKKQKKLIDVKPGHILIFYQNIVHEVLAKKTKWNQMRLFTSFRITDSLEPLFENEYKEAILNQGVPLIPSSQFPAMWSKHNWVYSIQRNALQTWCHCLKDIVCSDLEIKSKPELGTFRIVHREMNSLKHYGLEMYPEYSEQDKAIFIPSKI
jgi:hypothetical protein